MTYAPVVIIAASSLTRSRETAMGNMVLLRIDDILYSISLRKHLQVRNTSESDVVSYAPSTRSDLR
jgi:hypothetical protein